MRKLIGLSKDLLKNQKNLALSKKSKKEGGIKSLHKKSVRLSKDLSLDVRRKRPKGKKTTN
tara:strand:+ start:1484 stop:1666 length:183 start_codon:yes stop_codon:yes gene_type:complete